MLSSVLQIRFSIAVNKISVDQALQLWKKFDILLQYFFLNVLMLCSHLCVVKAVKYEVRIFAGYDCVSVAAPIWPGQRFCPPGDWEGKNRKGMIVGKEEKAMIIDIVKNSSGVAIEKLWFYYIEHIIYIQI